MVLHDLKKIALIFLYSLTSHNLFMKVGNDFVLAKGVLISWIALLNG